MKKITLLGCFIFILTGFAMAQNDFPTATNSSVKIDGGNINLIRPVKDGGWARGLFYYNTYSEGKWAGIGLFGSGESARSIYISHGDKPWNSTKGIHIKSNGHTGVGTRFPVSPLSVSNYAGGELASLIDTETDETTANPYMAFYYGSTPTRLGYVGYGSTNNHNLYVTNDKGGLTFRDHTGNVMYVQDGKVGIGITNPSTKLETSGTIRINSITPALHFKENDITDNNFQVDVSGGNFNIRTNNNSFSSATTRFSVNQNGNAVLYGKFEAKEIKVQNAPTADFVFEENYKLKDINEVESFVKENKHLPDFPSAKEIEEDGVNLAEMDAKLLQKIEELTLYMIEQNKRMEKLETENEELKEKITEVLTTK